MVEPARFEVVLVELDPTVGSEIRKTRPCAVISPNEMNQALRTLVVAPMTTKGRAYPWRVPVEFGGKAGHVALDQIRIVDQRRLVKRLGNLDRRTTVKLLDTLGQMFAP